MSEWVKVAEVDDLGPGEGFETELEVNGEMIGLFFIDGKYYALGECPHERGPLCQGIIEGTQVMCPWHSARFEITTGECVEGPNACRVSGDVSVGKETTIETLPACDTYETKVEGNDVFVLARE
ncbi:MAG: Rieske (2Fe-2S) protein [Candidatus Krumholzibacteriia bacterium]